MISKQQITFRSVLPFLACLLGHFAVSPCAQSAGSEPATDQLQTLFSNHCTGCHGDDPDDLAADIDLANFSPSQSSEAGATLVKKILDVIDKGFMPPEGEPGLNEQDKALAVGNLTQILQTQISSASPTSDKTSIRRMNRLQYNNAVQDLLKLKVEVFPLRERMMRDLSGYFDPASGKMPDTVVVASRPLGKFQTMDPHLRGVTAFPQDLRAEHGFDNQTDHLTLSPLLMESFVRLSRAIIDSPDFNEQNVGIWQALFVAPEKLPAAAGLRSSTEKRLRKLLVRAFRCPADEPTLQRYTNYVVNLVEDGVSYSDAMKEAVAAVLASPRFLYLHDSSQALPRTNAQQVSYRIANRLAAFLWVSTPDDRLLSLAESGTLTEPETLKQQTDRMLHDKRLKRFCDSFPAQWLQLERIISTEPDQQLYPQFYFAKYRVSMHMMLEPLLLFETLLIENRSIIELIDSPFSYRSKLLTAWYRDGSQQEVGPPTKVNMRRVAVNDRRTGGVITTAAVMSMTSGSRDSKPITRGAWLASVILNDPPEPPPADVPALPEVEDANLEKLTIRERFSQHRSNTACAGCHVRLDPLGFALENYDAAGIWRDRYANGRPVDASGQLFGSHRFSNITEFKDALLAEKKRFAHAFTSHLLTFALARKMTALDSLAIDDIVNAAEADDFRFHALVHHLVQSEIFRR
ncbi:MAG: DUF1592 domain-containing protein [Aureliella sp.]